MMVHDGDDDDDDDDDEDDASVEEKVMQLPDMVPFIRYGDGWGRSGDDVA
jgi:hypothetical protein